MENERSTVKRTRKETLNTADRWLEMLVPVGMLLLFTYLFSHQRQNTGFFTGEFGLLEQLCLYVPIFAALASPIIRAVTGRRNPGRPFEAATYLLLAAGSLWLFIRFPFDFPHLGDLLPQWFQWSLNWVTNPLGKIPLVFQFVAGPFYAIGVMVMYFKTRREARSQPASE